jgi:hypothetical protein
MQQPPDRRVAPATTQTSSNPQYPYVLSYLGLRRCIGIIGITLPFVLIFGKWFFESPGILPSISAYYYSVMRDVFVGSLCAAGVFLLSYRFDLASDLTGDLAGIAAIGSAFFPTSPTTGATDHQIMIGIAHSVFSALFFASLAFFALVLFPRLDPGKQLTPQKQTRNTIYRLCGVIILLCIALSLGDLFLHTNQQLQALNPGFWLETIAILAFGVAWFIKGETLLQDQ